jgi:hypothetical protein
MSGSLMLTHKLSFIEIANKLVDTEDEMTIIKIIQILLIIINRNDTSKPPFADHLLSLCLKAFINKSQLIRNNILAVLRELYHLLFELLTKEINAQEVNSELHHACYNQLKQLIEIAGGKYKDTAFKGLGMDIITVILTECPLINDAAISSLIQKAYAFTLSGCLVNELDNYPLTIRAVKSVVQIIVTLKHSYTLLQPILLLANSENSWQRYLALEAFCSIFTDYKQIQNMNLLVNEQKHTRVV